MGTEQKIIPCAVALGDFDGIHLGHQSVLRSAAETGLLPIAMLIHCPFSILTQQDTERLLREMGISPVTMDFEEIRDMNGEMFVKDILKEQRSAAVVCCGYNYHFGKDGQWNVQDLKRFCEREGMRLLVSPEVRTSSGHPVSSTRIREAVCQGDMPLAAELLGRCYTYTIKVSKGDQRGRTIGFPTINQRLDSRLVPPRFGVYASRTKVGAQWYQSITNIGIRPTYQLDVPQSETHIIGYEGDLYGQALTVALVRRLRDELRFASLSALKAQIRLDIQTVKEIEA